MKGCAGLRKIAVVLIIVAAVLSLAASGCTVQKGLAGQSPGLYSPLQCREIVYLHDQLVVYLKKTIAAGTFSDLAGQAENQGDEIAAGKDSSGLPVLINNSPAAGTVFFFLADDDINMALCLFRPGE